MSIETKFGDPEIFEAISDIHLFFPISKMLIPICKDFGLTPNMITTLSLICTLNCYMKINKNKKEAMFSYFLGYLLDCMDGMMARKYNMGSNFGMTYDLVTDTISNALILQLMFTKKNIPPNIKAMIAVMLIFLMLLNSFNEAHCAFEKTGNDNFYKIKKNQLKENTGFLKEIYLKIEESNYDIYKKIIPVYDEKKVLAYVKYFKMCGPGNFCLMMIYIMNKYF